MGFEEWKDREALALFDSLRGKFIIGQALHIAVRELEKVPEQYREVSNIRDMKALQRIFFPYAVVEQATREMAREGGGDG